ncbi:DUF1577 domain-containing protein [Leptospira ellisii]|uniref:DUF1577 domain-containing protein n=2 Tax=Leptospira ellisii TaxID=2023197 RepID=A0A2N0BCP1_9LEPT|nr:DUF1577 domain-containing protein [Leptospira ellisii]MDV6236009.1 DUF1577 domain-containing protein [Leptospira ellisii]PJZ94283.1 hypothetical protein CH379_03570 [Leptospira ellisii]
MIESFRPSQKKTRELDTIRSPEQRKHIIEKHLLNQSLLIKGQESGISMIVRKYIDDGEKILVEYNGESEFSENQELLLYRVLAKYIQVECSFFRSLGPQQAELSVHQISIAKTNRAFPRYPVSDDAAHVTNINSSKTVIDASLFNIPTLVKVSFEDYRAKLKTYDLGLVEIDVFKPEQEEKFDLVKRTQKYIHIENTSDLQSYGSKNEKQISIEDEMNDEPELLARKYKDEKILSEIIFPIVYVNHSRQSIPLGYIWVRNKEKHLGADTVQKISELSKEMVARIKESNTVISTEKFQILDISNNGICIKVVDTQLVQTLPKHAGFVFDIYIRMQGYFKVFGAIRWISYDSTGGLILGIELVGKSGFPGEREKFHKNVELLGQGKFAGLRPATAAATGNS